MLLVEFDLAGAEWVVVAYLSGDPNMLEVVNSGKSPHVVTGTLISGASEEFVLAEHKAVGANTDPDTIMGLRESLDVPSGIFLPRSMSIRQAGKKSNHGCNYYMRYKRFALENEMPEADAEPIVKFYSEKAYPGLQLYWEDIRETLRRQGRVLTNCFGRKVRMVGEWGVELWMAAYSFKPQSTVFDVCRRGMVRAFHDYSLDFLSMELGAQVHDSLMAAYPIPSDDNGWYKLAAFIHKMVYGHMRSEIQYTGVVDNIERSFYLGVDAKIGHSWGDMQAVKVTRDLDTLVRELKQILSLPPENDADEEAEWSANMLRHPELPSA
jgi:hypothetical protein